MMEEARADLLSGMKEITTCVRSIGLPSKDDTVLGYIINCGMPAKKLGGIWISRRSSIIKWALEYCDPDKKVTFPEEPPKQEPEKKATSSVSIKKTENKKACRARSSTAPKTHSPGM